MADLRRPVVDDRPTELQLGEWTAFLDGCAVRLMVEEFDLLRLLIAVPGRVVRHEELCAVIWGVGSLTAMADADGAWWRKKVLRVVTRLSTKLQATPSERALIQPVQGVGYRIEAADALLFTWTRPELCSKAPRTKAKSVPAAPHRHAWRQPAGGA